MKSPRISLEQWLAFKTVVDEGSYALAAEALNKSQSAISYAISRLNHQLPQAVLRLEGRKAVMTEQGQVLYRYAEQLVKQASTAEAVANSLAMGFESEVTVAVDALIEIGALLCAVEKFSRHFPHTRIRVLETSLSGTTEALIEKQADLVIGSVTPIGFSGIDLTRVTMIAVAAPDHALIKGKDDVSELQLRGYRQVVLRDTGSRQERDAGWLQAQQRWTVSHFSSSITLIKSGLAFGFLPENWIAGELRRGELCRIPLPQSMDRTISMKLLLADNEAAGPASRALADLILEHYKAAIV